jgi:hypothetical protein
LLAPTIERLLVSARTALNRPVSTPLPSGERLDLGWTIDVLRGHEPVDRATD